MKNKGLLATILSLSLLASVASAQSTNTLYMTFQRSDDGTNWVTMGTSGLKRIPANGDFQFYRTSLVQSTNTPDVAPEGYTYYNLTIQSSANGTTYTNLYYFTNLPLDIAPNQKIKTSLTLTPFTP